MLILYSYCIPDHFSSPPSLSSTTILPITYIPTLVLSTFVESLCSFYTHIVFLTLFSFNCFLDPAAIGVFCSDQLSSCPIPFAPPQCLPNIKLAAAVIKSYTDPCLCVMMGCDGEPACHNCPPVEAITCNPGSTYLLKYDYFPFQDFSCVCTYQVCQPYA